MDTKLFSGTLIATGCLLLGVAQATADRGDWGAPNTNFADAVPVTEAYADNSAHLIEATSETGPNFIDLTLPPELMPFVLASAPEAPTAAGQPGTANGPQAGHESLAQKATNPIANLVQVQVQNIIVPNSRGAKGYSNAFVVQPVIPFKIGEQQFVNRTTFTWLNTPDPDGPVGETSGLGDTAMLNFAVFDVEDAMIGVGPSATFPTANDDRTGTGAGKWQLGPALLYLNIKGIKNVQWGMLAYQNWTIASTGNNRDRPDVSTLYLQPIFNWHLEDGWYLSWQDTPITIDWENDNELHFPVGAKLGRVTKIGEQPVNMFIMPYYVAGNPSHGPDWAIKLSISFLFPK